MPRLHLQTVACTRGWSLAIQCSFGHLAIGFNFQLWLRLADGRGGVYPAPLPTGARAPAPRGGAAQWWEQEGLFSKPLSNCRAAQSPSWTARWPGNKTSGRPRTRLDRRLKDVFQRYEALAGFDHTSRTRLRLPRALASEDGGSRPRLGGTWNGGRWRGAGLGPIFRPQVPDAPFVVQGLAEELWRGWERGSRHVDGLGGTTASP